MSLDAKSKICSGKTRDVEPPQGEHIERCLIKSLLVDFVRMAANANIKTLTNVKFML